MLSVKNLVKTYQTKTGECVRALDGVSIDFPTKGMVFLLGKSGSGKSTLLNVAGGLDLPSDGEIIVDGRSSKDFSATDFDGYRNSHIGFVFQEFNMLDEFNIEQNIALALQLQNKPNDKAAVKEILKAVDLEGVGKRRPNTLSGGQKQRVAIARALIKNPQIIMADEPTGALDSVTGKQIFETLKKLSETRLVIVVTHDREFAEEYGDRIIELSDGKIISDLSRNTIDISDGDGNVTMVSSDTFKVNDWEKISEEDVKKIVAVMKKNKGCSVITVKENLDKEHQKTVEESTAKTATAFSQTVEKVGARQVPSGQKFIKSNLPFANAFKMATESLKLKPIRLAFTIFLSIIAFVLFGIAGTFMLYDPNYSVSTALEGSEYQSVVLEKKYQAYFTAKELDENGKGIVENTYGSVRRTAFTEEEVNRLNQNDDGLSFAGIIDLGKYTNNLTSIEGYSSEDLLSLRRTGVQPSLRYYYSVRGLCGFSDCGEEFMEANGFRAIAGRYPQKHTEIAVSQYVYELYKFSTAENGKVNYLSPSEFFGEQIEVDDITFTVVGVYDVGEIPKKFIELQNLDSQLDEFGTLKLKDELVDLIQFSFHTVGFVSKDFYETYKDTNVKIGTRDVYGTAFSEEDNSNVYVYPNRWECVHTDKSIWEYRDLFKCYSLTGEEIELGVNKNEIMLPINTLFDYANEFYVKIKQNPASDYSKFEDAYNKWISKEITGDELVLMAETLFSDYKDVMGEDFNFPKTIYVKNASDKTTTLNVVGIYLIKSGVSVYSYQYYLSDDFAEEITLKIQGGQRNEYFTDYKDFDVRNEKYGRLISNTENKISQSMYMLSSGRNGSWYAMRNRVYKNAFEVADAVDGMKMIFYVAGGVFGLLAILMLFNFISVTVSSKQKEIGILRAIGARKLDVFKIFVVESLIITLSCFVVSVIICAIGCNVLNGYLVSSALGIKALDFGVMSVIIMLVSTIAVAAIATVVPVSKAAKKAPVDSIRAL